MSVNKVILVGNVGNEPEIRETSRLKKIANFSLATSTFWKDRDTGERKDKTEWHRIVIFSEGLVGIIEKYVKKGSKLYLEGSLQTRKWTDNNGIDKYTTEVILQGYNCTLTMLDKAGDTENQNYTNFEGVDSISTNNRSNTENKPNKNTDDKKSNVEEVLDDDIPF